MDRELTLRIAGDMGRMILDARIQLESERHHPGGDPDKSDDKIKDLETGIQKLESMRNDFECLATRYL